MNWCTYRTSHPSGVFYEGKGKTYAVTSGAYRGSGIRFKLAITCDGFQEEFWTTVVLETFATEAEAYAAEALLVPLSSLANPLRLNMVAGGDGAMRQNHSLLYKKHNAAKKRERVAAAKERKRIREEKIKEREVARKAKEKARFDKMKQKLKGKK
jgi:hypothetical protein